MVGPVRSFARSLQGLLALCLAAAPALPAASAVEPQRTGPLVGLEWLAPDEQGGGRGALTVVALDRGGAESGRLADASFSRLLCTPARGRAELLPLVTVSRTEGQREAGLVISTAPIAADDAEHWQKAFRFIKKFFDALAAACPQRERQGHCVATVARTVELMNRREVDGDLLAVDNQGGEHACGGPEFAPTGARERAAAEPERQRQGDRVQRSGLRPGLRYPRDFSPAVALERGLAQAIFPVRLEAVARGALLPLYSQAKEGRRAKKAYALAIKNQGGLRELLGRQGLELSAQQLGFWALFIAAVNAEARRDEPEDRRGVQNLLLRTSLGELFGRLYPGRQEALTDRLARDLADNFFAGTRGKGALQAAIDDWFDAIKRGSATPGRHQVAAPIDDGGELSVVLETRFEDPLAAQLRPVFTDQQGNLGLGRPELLLKLLDPLR